MICFKATRFMLFLAGTLVLYGSFGWAAEGVIAKVPDPAGKFCHLKFPAIREDTLSWSRPMLKDPSEGDIIEFYGPCDHDPLGKAEIQRQRADFARQWSRPSD